MKETALHRALDLSLEVPKPPQERKTVEPICGSLFAWRFGTSHPGHEVVRFLVCGWVWVVVVVFVTS